MTTYAAAMYSARRQFRDAGIENAALDARLLMAGAAGLDMAALMASSGETIPALAERAFDTHVNRRLDREPVARILGEKEFWGLPFMVNAATLVPRPETETLVGSVLAELRCREFAPSLCICDLGTGCGAILIALLTELPEAKGVATDISAEALAMARANAERFAVANRIDFRQDDFAVAPDGPFEIVVSNPPYVRSGAIDGLAPEVRDYDPHAALDGGADGLAAYRAILTRIDTLLGSDGLLALEVGHDQAGQVATLCREQACDDIGIRSDLAGIGRVVLASRHAGSKPKGRRAKKALGKLTVSG